MDLGVGYGLRKFREVQDKLAKVISAKTSVSEKEAKQAMLKWMDSRKTFMTMMKKYQSLDIFDGAKCGTLDKIRTDRNHFAHDYRGDTSEYGRLKSFIENMNSILRFLEHVDVKTTADLKKVEKISKEEKKRLIMRAARECKMNEDGYVRISDIGLVLKANGFRFKGLAKTCNELDITLYVNSEGDPNTHYIKMQ